MFQKDLLAVLNFFLICDQQHVFFHNSSVTSQVGFNFLNCCSGLMVVFLLDFKSAALIDIHEYVDQSASCFLVIF
jgi:hypothetical protein